MTKQELITITTKSDVPDSVKVVIKLTYPDGTIDNLQIDSFSIFSDCITLNAKPNIIAVGAEFKSKKQFEDENQSEPEWWSDGFANLNHNHHLKVNDCVVVMDSNTNTLRIFFVTSFDYDADYAARGVLLYDHGICSDQAIGLEKYRKATKDETKHAIQHMSDYVWESLPTQLQEQYKQYR